MLQYRKNILNCYCNVTKKLHVQSGRKVFVPFDTSLDIEEKKLSSLMQVKKIYKLMKDLIRELFKDNEHIEKGLIYGNLNVDDSFFEGLDVKRYCYPYDKRYYKYFTVIDDELQKVLFENNLKVSIRKFRKWYGGYKLLNGTGEQVYPPIVVSYFLEEPNTWNTEFVRDFFHFQSFSNNETIKQTIKSIYLNENTQFEFRKEYYSLSDIMVIRNALNANRKTKLEQYEIDLFLMTK